MNMKTPKTTKEEPYIEFRFDKNGKLKLSKTSSWYGGVKSGFTASDGSHGNSCEPRHLEARIASYKNRMVKDLDKKILALQKEKGKLKINLGVKDIPETEPEVNKNKTDWFNAYQYIDDWLFNELDLLGLEFVTGFQSPELNTKASIERLITNIAFKVKNVKQYKAY